MVKIMVLLTKPEDQRGFEDYYFNTHVPLIKNLPEVKDVMIQRTFDVQNMSVAPYLTAEFSFENKEVMEFSLGSYQGQKLYDDVPNLMKYLAHPPMILFCE